MIDFNNMYRRTLDEYVKKDCYTFKDFGEACNRLKLPFFEVVDYSNPFAVEQTKSKNMYDGFDEFRKSMPNWSARDYDYEHDHVGAYYEIKGIQEGCFEIRDSNNSMSYSWCFLVTDTAVIVRTRKTFID